MTKPKMMRIAYATIAAALGLALSSSFSTGALAANPHFIGSPSTCTSSISGNTATLKCTQGSVAGLGNAVSAKITATATLIFSCQSSTSATGASTSVSSDHGRTLYPGGSVSTSGSAGSCTPVLTSATWSSVLINFYDQSGASLGAVAPTVR